MNRYSLPLTALVLVALPFVFRTSFALAFLSQVGALTIFAMSYNLLLGGLGLLSFGHAVFFGLAGFSTGHFMLALDGAGASAAWLPLVPLLGAAIGAAAGIVVGFISVRSGGLAFAMISLGIAELVSASALIFVSFFHGEAGVSFDRALAPVMGITFGPIGQVYWLVAGWVFIVLVFMAHLARTPLGLAGYAVRDNAERAGFLGYRPVRVRFFNFIIAAAVAGVGGALYAIVFEHVGFESLGLAQTGLVLFMVYIGGTGVFFGPVLGALLVTYLHTVVSRVTPAWSFYLGVTFLLVVVFVPGGIGGLISKHIAILRERPRASVSLAGPYLAGAAVIALTFLGLVMLVEMTGFLSSPTRMGSVMRVFGIPLDVSSAASWIAGVLLVAVGLVLCRYSMPMVRARFRAALPAEQGSKQ